MATPLLGLILFSQVEGRDMAEHLIQNQILKNVSRGTTRLFRNNTGQGWTGSHIIRTPGSITIYDPRPLSAGLVKGSSD